MNRGASESCHSKQPRDRVRYLGCTQFILMRPSSPKLRIHLTAVAGLLVSALLMDACNKTDVSPTGPTPPPPPGSSIVYTAVGASDAAGVGSSVVCIPFTDCPNGMGYVQVATRTLKASGYNVSLTNLGIPTAVIGPDFQALGVRYGRTIVGNFIDSEAPFVATGSTLVTIFAGGNDVLTILDAIDGGAAGSDVNSYVDQQVRAFGADFTMLLNVIHGRAMSSPRIVVLNLPNVAGFPLEASASLARRQAAQRASVGMTTTVINPLTSAGIVVIDLMCDPRSYQASTFSSDGFHPSDTGYAWIAAEVVSAATTAYHAPASSCSSMTIVPNS